MRLTRIDFAVTTLILTLDTACAVILPERSRSQRALGPPIQQADADAVAQTAYRRMVADPELRPIVATLSNPTISDFWMTSELALHGQPLRALRKAEAARVLGKVASLLFESFAPLRRQHPRGRSYIAKLIIDGQELGSIAVDGVDPAQTRVSYIHRWSGPSGTARAAAPLDPALMGPVATGTGRAPLTPKEAYDLALARAVKWQKDALLHELQTLGDAGVDAEGRSSAWVFKFYSDAAAEIYSLIVQDGSIRPGFPQPADGLRTVPVDAPRILDGRRLVEIAEAAGGRAYSTRGARPRVVLQSVASTRRAAWYVHYEDSAKTNRRDLLVIIDAETGQVLHTSR